MAELVVKAECRSPLRTSMQAILNVTFPVWGIGFPLAAVGLILCAIGFYQQGNFAQAFSLLLVMALVACSAVICLLMKRFLSNDIMIVDRAGLKLPRLLGNTVNFRNYLSWADVDTIKAVVPTNDPSDLERCRLAIYKKNGAPLILSPKVLEAQFIEQLLLAAHMWAPSLCDTSLDSLQNLLRIGDGGASGESSYTALWEEELGRRFCPAAYVALEPGRSLRNNSLKVVNHLASGGLSSLYLCQLDGRKLVVLKEAVVPDDSPENVRTKAAEMFQREAELLMKLDHSNIVRVLDYFAEGSRNYMMLEYVNGTDLRQMVRQNGPQTEGQVLDWAISIATTLKHLHEREKPIVHRDFTPDNMVLRNDGQVIIVDFGAANEFIGNATGTFVGKNAFIAPEQLRGKATVHSDIYAFGCTLFFLLTGQEPEALCPSNPAELNKNLSEELCTFILTCTQLEASDRYQSAAQMIPVLKGIAAQSVVL